jgi:hypothetical protein
MIDDDKKVDHSFGLKEVCISACVVVILFVFGWVVLNGSQGSIDICDEITSMMLDDPEHMRLHNDYSNLMNYLHLYLDKNCQGMDMP